MITESNLPSSSSSSSISSSNLAANATNGNVNSNNTSNSNNTNNSSNNNINNNNNNNAVNGNSATSPLQSTNTTATATVSSTTTTATGAVPGTSASTQSSSGTFGTDNRWIFPLESVEQTPSRSDGVSSEEELNERQDAALFISDLGALLKVNQLCINTAIIYMHRFYMIHSLKKFNRYMVATACLFLACKVEEQPRRLREFIDAIQNLFHKSASDNYNPEEFRKNGDEIVALESCLLQTLGFSVLVNHAHTVIIKTCQMIKAPRDLAEAAYLTATNSLILTNFCVKFSSEKIACFCIYLACKWTGLMIPVSSEGLQWYQYVRHDIQEQELEDISKEYLTIYDKCLPKIQKKLGKTKSCDPTISSTNQTSNHQSHHPAAQKYHHQQQQAHGHGPAHHNPHQVHPNIKKSSHHLIDNQTHASNVNIKQQPSYPANVAGKPSLSGSTASHNYPHASQQPQPQPQPQQQPHQHSQHHHQMQQPKHNNLPYPQHHQSQPAHHPNHPPPTQHHQQQQQQQRPSQNLNKSLNLPTSNTSNQIKQPIKHPSSSHLTSNKSNGSQILNQNGATQAQSNLNIKTEKHIQHHQTNNNNNNHHPHHINNNNNNNNNNHHHQNLDNHSIENNNVNSASKNLVTNKNAVNNAKPVNSLNIKTEPGTQASTSSSTPPATSSGASGSSSMKRGNEDLTSAPNKIPKYIIDQKSAS